MYTFIDNGRELGRELYGALYYKQVPNVKTYPM
jgi:hypothetical protein